MSEVVRVGDRNNATPIPEPVTSTLQSTVFANGILVVVDGSPTSHIIATAPARTAGGSSNVFAEGKPINIVGNTDTCGHIRAEGSPNVNVN